jgi:hypothetical protein
VGWHSGDHRDDVTNRDPLGLLQARADAAPPVTLRLAERLRVAFRGQRGGQGPATVGQASTLAWVSDLTAYTRMLEWPLSLPPGTTLADITAALEVLLARHESLRTCYPPASTPVQRVAQSGELLVDVYEAGGPAGAGGGAGGEPGRGAGGGPGGGAGDSPVPTDGAALTAGLVRLLRAREFDVAEGLPLRVGVACRDGMPAAAVIVYSHMAADFTSMALIDRQFVTLASDPASRQPGPLGHQPLDQAADERSERGRRRIEAAVRGWEASLRAIPQCLYAVPSADPRRSGGPASGWLWSPAGALALPHIAARTGASPQQVVFGALCALLGWRTGHDECVLSAAASNRYRRHLREYVGPLAQECLICVNVRADGLDEVVRRGMAAALRGTRVSLVDAAAIGRAIERVQHDRGIAYYRYCVFNDISTQFGDGEVRPPGCGPAAARQALHRSRFVLLPQPPCDQLLLVMLQQVDEELVIGAMTRDANRVPPAELELVLRGVESLLVAAASGDVELSRIGEITDVRPVDRGPGWLRTDRGWVELAEVQRLVTDALPAPSAAFAVQEPCGSIALVAYLVAGNGVGTPEQAHAACQTTLAGTGRLEPPDGIRYTAMAPARYVICASAPGDTGDLSAWRRQPVVAEGDGRCPAPA